MPVNAPLTKSTTDNLSRRNLLDWINQKTSKKYNKIEELCSGIAYCQIMELFFPGSVPLKKIKFDANLEIDYIHNLKLFQNSFLKINVEKNVPIERLVKGKFQDNFEFLQWFKKFCEANSTKSEKIKQKAATSRPNSQSTPSIDKNNLHINTPAFFKSIPKRRSMQSTPKSSKLLTSNGTTPKTPLTIASLSEQLEELKIEIPIFQNERDFYLNKLKQIELIIEEEEEKSKPTDFAQKVKNILYSPSEMETNHNM